MYFFGISHPICADYQDICVSKQKLSFLSASSCLFLLGHHPPRQWEWVGLATTLRNLAQPWEHLWANRPWEHLEGALPVPTKPHLRRKPSEGRRSPLPPAL